MSSPHAFGSPGELARHLLNELGPSSVNSPDQRIELGKLAALIEIGDRLGGIERTLDDW